MELLQTFWKLIQFRAGPDELPSSLGLLVFIVLLTVVINIAQLTATLDVEHAAEQTGVILIVTLSFVYGLLRWRELSHRYIQTITGILGASLVINMVLTPLVIMAPYFFSEGNSEQIRMMATFVYLVLLFFVNLWLVLVMGFIFQRALNSTLFTGVMATMCLFGLNMLILTQFFPL